MFSSPGKQAQQAAQASGQISDQEISKLLNYTDTHQQELRDAINKQGPNPYFGAAQQLNPQAYYTNPHDTTTFSAGGLGSGLTPGSSSAQQSSPFLPPLPHVILPPSEMPQPPPAPAPPPAPSGPPQTNKPAPGGGGGGVGPGGGYPGYGGYPGGWQPPHRGL